VTKAKVDVYRRQGALAVTVGCEPPLPESARSMVATRIAAAVRAVDRHATGIDIGFADYALMS
jgi:hypothetical protein